MPGDQTGQFLILGIGDLHPNEFIEKLGEFDIRVVLPHRA